MSVRRVCLRVRGARGALLLLLVVACATGESSLDVTRWGIWHWEGRQPPDYINFDGIEVLCYSRKLENWSALQLQDFDIDPFNCTEVQLTHKHINSATPTAKLELKQCPMPNGSLADTLAALQYPFLELEELTLFPNAGRNLRAENFAGLHLRKLVVKFAFGRIGMEDVTPLNPDIIASVPELRELEIEYAVLSPLPLTSRLRTVRLEGVQWEGAWGGCAELRELTLDFLQSTVEEGWLAHCPLLSSLHIKSLNWQWRAPSIVGLFRGLRAVTSLEIGYIINDLSSTQLDTIFSEMRLKNLSLPLGMFKQISENTLSTALASLEKLFLHGQIWSDYWYDARNEITYHTLEKSLARLPGLRDLVLKDSGNTDFCDLVFENGSLPALRRLTLAGSGMKKNCFDAWDSLEYLDLGGTEIRELQLGKLPRARAHSLEVKVASVAIPLDEAGYNSLLDRFHEMTNLTIHWGAFVRCHCEHGWLSRAMRSLSLSVRGVRCFDLHRANLLLSDVPADWLECESVPCSSTCSCGRAWRDNTTTAVCGSWTTSVPSLPDLRALHAAGSGIATLHADDLPNSLLILNLTNSKIKRLEAAAVDALFNVSARVMWLAGNPLACDCTNRPLLAALQRHRDQVQDYERITCVDGRALHALDVEALPTPLANCLNHINPAYLKKMLAKGDFPPLLPSCIIYLRIDTTHANICKCLYEDMVCD